MNPTDYEHFVADLLRLEGWTANVTPPTSDGGVDIIAEQPGRRLGVQVKMYGSGSRKVNPQAVRELFGAATEIGCNEFMVVTDGSWLQTTEASADSLGVTLRHEPARESPNHQEARRTGVTFGEVWTEIEGLVGRELTSPSGTTNRVVKVDGGGLTRLSSNGRSSHINIEIFQRTVNRLLAGETVTRSEINQHYVGRASSGVVLVLSSLPRFELTELDGGTAVRLAGE